MGVGGAGSARSRLAIPSFLPQISPIASESQASLASGRPAGIAGPAHELLSASAQMALQR